MSMNPMEKGRFEWTLTDRLRKAREEAELTQRELADRIPTSLRTVSNYENPAYQSERKPVVVKQWALACGFPYELVMFGIDTSDGPDGGATEASPEAAQGSGHPSNARSRWSERQPVYGVLELLPTAA